MAKDDKTPPQAGQKPNEDTALSAGGDKSAVKQQAQTAALENGESSNAPLDGKIVRRPQGEGRRTASLPDVSVNALHAVEEDVYEEFYAENSLRPLYRLRYPRGTVVLKAEFDAFMGGNVEVEGVGNVREQVVGAEGEVGGIVERG